MEVGEERQPDESKQIIRDPEGYDDIKKKFKEREEEQLKKALERRRVETAEDLQKFGAQAILRRTDRVEHTTLKERKILIDPKSPEISNMRKQLERETQQLAQETLRRIATLPPEEAKKIRALKGRVTGPSAPTGPTSGD